MPQYCCVPGCREKVGGHQFPKDEETKLKWRVAIRRIEPSTKKLWYPKARDVVCPAHFKKEDYRPAGILGERQRLVPDAVPSAFNFRQQPSSGRRVIERKIEAAGEVSPVAADDLPEVAAFISIDSINKRAVIEDTLTYMQDSGVSDAEVQCQLKGGLGEVFHPKF